MTYAIVDTLAARGFRVGPDPDSVCEGCPHRWGSHLLHPITESPLDGGTWSCPEDCPCFGTWDVPVPDHLREAYRRQKYDRPGS